MIRRPIKAVLLTGTADDALRVDADAVAVVTVGIFVLGIDKGEAGLDGIEFVAPDTAEQDFLPPARRVELPPRLRANQRDRKREIVGADDQRCPLAFDLD